MTPKNKSSVNEKFFNWKILFLQIPVTLSGLNLDGTHMTTSVNHLQAVHAQMQSQQQQQLHQSQQQQQHHLQSHQNAQNSGGQGTQSQATQRDDHKVKDEGGSCTTERCSDNQVHCQVQCDLQLQTPQDLQQTLLQQQQQMNVISSGGSAESGSQTKTENSEKDKDNLRQLTMAQ